MHVSYSERSSVIALMWSDHSNKHDVRETSSYIRVYAMCGSVGYWKIIFQYEQKTRFLGVFQFFFFLSQKDFYVP